MSMGSMLPAIVVVVVVDDLKEGNGRNQNLSRERVVVCVHVLQ